MWTNQPGQIWCLLLQCLQKQSCIGKFVLIWRVFQQFDCFGIGRFFISGTPLETDPLKGLVIRKEQLVIECQLRIKRVPRTMWLSSCAITMASDASSGNTS